MCPLSSPPLSHLFITTPFGTPLYFHADYIEVFPLECLRHQCNQGGQNKTFWRILLKQIIKWRHVNNQLT